jgi:Mg2+ and Co2+ transporter CorA
VGKLNYRVEKLEQRSEDGATWVDVTQLTDEELKRLAGSKAPDLRSLTDEELKAIVRGEGHENWQTS